LISSKQIIPILKAFCQSRGQNLERLIKLFI